MNRKDVELQQEIIDSMDKDIKRTKIFEIRTKHSLTAKKKGVELNQGYEFDVDTSMPELADAIAKFAKELPKNGFGEDSDRYFITLIHQYFDKL